MNAETLIREPALASAMDHRGLAAGVSWGAALAGAVAAAALSFILLILGMGLGLSSVSPYAYHAAPLGPAAIAWIAFTQLAASAIGGYLAGRLRVKWSGVHSDEVHFRDTAHGLLAWAVATLLTVSVLAGGVRTALGGAIDAGAAAAPALTAGDGTGTGSSTGTGTGTVNGNGAARMNSYFADMVLRAPTADSATDAQRAEVNRILTADLAAGTLSPDDRGYLAQILSRRSGLSEADAEARVDQIYTQAAQSAANAKARVQAGADTARRSAAHTALWMFVALLLGAFIASLCATIGGRGRDHARVVVRPAP